MAALLQSGRLSLPHLPPATSIGGPGPVPCQQRRASRRPALEDAAAPRMKLGARQLGACWRSRRSAARDRCLLVEPNDCGSFAGSAELAVQSNRRGNCRSRASGHMRREGFLTSGFQQITRRSEVGRSRSVLSAIKIDRSRIQERSPEEEDINDMELCPVGCVREIHSKAELDHAIQSAKEHRALVVVDFYKTACGSCKYIEHGFAKLCRGEAEAQHPVVFLKHNVMDEYEEETDLADAYRIKAVPLFHFYRDGVLVDSFATREKSRIQESITKYSSIL